jgi:hypothetical protein
MGMMSHLVCAAKELVINLNRGVSDPNFKVRAYYLNDPAFKRHLKDPQFIKDIKRGGLVIVFHHGPCSLSKVIDPIDEHDIRNLSTQADEFDAFHTTACTRKPPTQREALFPVLYSKIRTLSAISGTHFGTCNFILHNRALVGPISYGAAVKEKLVEVNYGYGSFLMSHAFCARCYVESCICLHPQLLKMFVVSCICSGRRSVFPRLMEFFRGMYLGKCS